MEGMMSLAETAQILGARAILPMAHGATLSATRYNGVSTDSRTLKKGALFVALRGDRFDGHEFLRSVSERGAAAAIIDQSGAVEFEHGVATAAPAAQSAAAASMPLLVVEDTRRALGRLASHWRSKFRLPLIAVSGSNGKTTVKEMIAAILRAHYGIDATLATAGNLNNDIGLPLTLFGLRATHAAAVVELGMNHPGETRELAAIAHPTVALVNNAQREHQEFMTSVAEVAREHGALFQSLPPGGVAVINADDDYAGYWRALCAGCAIRDFGIDKPAAVSGRHAQTAAGTEIELTAPEGRVSFTLPVAGEHNVRNALAAAAAATAAGASLGSVAAALSAFAPVKGRLQRKHGQGGATVFDDTYNANPDSVRAAIEVLAQTGPAGTGKDVIRVLVLGDMGEVGEQGPAFHAEAGRHARDRGISQLLLTGELCRHAAAAFGQGAMHFERIEDLIAAARTHDRPGATLLVKGSRFMRMERVVEALVTSSGKAD
jgi:UDP-N-acetylmuramoyl-tripeptide--D-alanyl-D-alanine ligase